MERASFEVHRHNGFVASLALARAFVCRISSPFEGTNKIAFFGLF